MRNWFSLFPLVAAVALAACSQTATSGGTGTGLLPAPSQGINGVVRLNASPAPIKQLHVYTWDAVGIPGGTYNITMAQAAPWLNYVMTSPALSPAAKAVGMTTVLYSDPNRQFPGDVMWTNDETTFAHDCNNNRISISGSNTWLMEPHSTHLWQLWPAYVALVKSWHAQYDYIFEDSADEVNPNRFSSMPCNFNQNDWTTATNNLDNALGSPIIYNGLGLINGQGTTPGPAFGLNPTAFGGMSEDCYVGRTPTGYFYYPHWAATENTEIQMALGQKFFICHADQWVDAASNTALRTYFYASFLLTYDRDAMAVDTQFQTPSGLGVMPEVQLVPTQAVQKLPADVSSLMTSSGVYGREWNACYIAGQSVGPCAVAVNPNNPAKGPARAFPWPTKYHHTLQMTGAGVLDGGTVSTTGAAPPATMPGGSAVIVFQ
jgi:hypothetical protein